MGEKDMGQIINNIKFNQNDLLENYDPACKIRFRGKEADRICTSYQIYNRGTLNNIVSNVLCEKEIKTK